MKSGFGFFFGMDSVFLKHELAQPVPALWSAGQPELTSTASDPSHTSGSIPANGDTPCKPLSGTNTVCMDETFGWDMLTLLPC